MTKRKKVKLRVDRIILVVILLILVIFGGYTVISNLMKPKVDTPPVVDNPDDQQPEDTFSALYYYEAENEERYVAYQQKNPELTKADVVWRVNANLDKEFYTDIILIEDTSSSLLLVNKYYQLPQNYTPSNLESLANGKLVTQETKVAFEAMQEAANKDNVTLSVISGYRSYDYQSQLYKGYLEKNTQEEVDTFSARPGHSEHQTGQAIDIAGANGNYLEFGGTNESKWIEENAYKYGFIVRYQENIVQFTGYKYEPWHLRYVGVEIATDMHEKGITILEEYIVKYIDHKPE